MLRQALRANDLHGSAVSVLKANLTLSSFGVGKVKPVKRSRRFAVFSVVDGLGVRNTSSLQPQEFP